MSDSSSNHFHLTLPSNSSIDIYPNNTTAQYVTKLPKHIELNGYWRVLLKEISIPRTLVNIGSGTHMLQIMNKETRMVDDVVLMASTMYATPNAVVNELNKLTRQKYSIMFPNFMLRDENVRMIRIDVNSGRYFVHRTHDFPHFSDLVRYNMNSSVAITWRITP